MYDIYEHISKCSLFFKTAAVCHHTRSLFDRCLHSPHCGRVHHDKNASDSVLDYMLAERVVYLDPFAIRGHAPGSLYPIDLSHSFLFTGGKTNGKKTKKKFT